MIHGTKHQMTLLVSKQQYFFNLHILRMSLNTSFKKHGNIRSSIPRHTLESPEKLLKYPAKVEKH